MMKSMELTNRKLNELYELIKDSSIEVITKEEKAKVEKGEYEFKIACSVKTPDGNKFYRIDVIIGKTKESIRSFWVNFDFETQTIKSFWSN